MSHACHMHVMFRDRARALPYNNEKSDYLIAILPIFYIWTLKKKNTFPSLSGSAVMTHGSVCRPAEAEHHALKMDKEIEMLRWK